MKVKVCENCQHYRRKVWSSYYNPNNYHAIGMTHAFGYCAKLKDRCLKVKKCEEQPSDS